MPLIFIITVYIFSFFTDYLLPVSYGDLTMFIPGIMAVILTVLKREKLRLLFRLDGIKNISIGIAIPLFVALVIFGLSIAFSMATYGLDQETLNYHNGSVLKVVLKAFTMSFTYYFLGMQVIFSLGEELGWRGYLLNKLKKKIPSFYFRAFFVGFVWGGWHIPYYIQLGLTPLQMGIFLLNVILISVVFTWLFEKRQSVLPTVVAHATHNILFNAILPIITLKQSAPDIFFGESGVLATIAYVLAILIFIVVGKQRNKQIV
jgi:uncharacterized protein